MPTRCGLETLHILGERATLLATAEQTQGEFTAVLWESPYQPLATMDTSRTHVHERETQSYRIIRGRMGYELEGVCGVLLEGESLVIRPGQAHRTWNAGPGLGVCVSIMQPGGFEATLRALAAEEACQPLRPLWDQSAAAAELVASWNEFGHEAPDIARLLAASKHERSDKFVEAIHKLLCVDFGEQNLPTHEYGESLASALKSVRVLESLDMLGDRVHFLATGQSTGGEWFVAIVEEPPREARFAMPSHTHEREDQAYHVVSGCMAARVGDRFFLAGAGETFTIPKGVPHATWNAGLGTCTSLMLTRPAGLEHVYRSVAAKAGQEPHIPALEVAKRFLEHGVVHGGHDGLRVARAIEDYREQGHRARRSLQHASPALF